ncbi:MAG: NADP-dependent oxidoreductase [Acidobacteriota bacterium]
METQASALSGPTMRAVGIERFGGVEALRDGDWPAPQRRPQDVVIAVQAASINFRDGLIRGGRYVARRLLPQLPFVLGSDVAGRILETSDSRPELTAGTPVFAMQPSLRGFGGYAERIAVPAEVVARMPRGVSFAEAAAMPLAGLTALQALRDLGGLRPGERVAVVGASGGVGTFGVQIARALGAASVVGVASERNHELVASLGADRVLDYRRTDWIDRLGPIDVIFDAHGGGSLRELRPALASGGRFITTVPSPGALRDHLKTSLWPFGHRSRLVVVRSRADDLAELADLAERGAVRSVIDRLEPLDQAAELHQHSQSRRSRGKNVFAVGAEANEVPRPAVDRLG